MENNNSQKASVYNGIGLPEYFFYKQRWRVSIALWRGQRAAARLDIAAVGTVIKQTLNILTFPNSK